MTAAPGVVSAWDRLVADAVLGTERRPYTAPEVEGELADVVAGAGDIVGAASALWAYEEVGRVPPADGVANGVEPVGLDDRPLLPSGALRSLAAIVSEPSLRGLLGEWLGLAAGDGRRLPPEWIPVLLDQTPAGRRAELESAAGPRCAWLIGQRPEWAPWAKPRAASPVRGRAKETQVAVGAWLAQWSLGEAAEALTGEGGAWSAAVTDAVMAALGELVRSGDQSAPAPAVRDTLPRFALLADPQRAGTVAAVAGDIERLPAERRPAARLFWGRAVTSLNSLVQFRQAMRQEFQQP